MNNAVGILKIYPESFKANLYTIEPFRMIGLIDVDIIYNNSIEKVTLPFFRSSGTNSGKIKGLWYPIAGIKTVDGEFSEFTPYLNFVLSRSTKHGKANKGWLCKSLFFVGNSTDGSKVRGFSSGTHYESLYWIGQKLRTLYEAHEFESYGYLNSESLNKLVTSKEIYPGNKHSQRRNFEKFIQDVFDGV